MSRKIKMILDHNTFEVGDIISASYREKYLVLRKPFYNTSHWFYKSVNILSLNLLFRNRNYYTLKLIQL